MPRILELTGSHRSITSILEAQLDEVAIIIERQLASDLPAVNALCKHIERYRGKMLRPTMVLVTGLAAGGKAGDAESLTDAHRAVAAVTELIHMATLVHDDVLDEAQVRRRGGTVNHLRGNEAAVMLGDYLISNAFHLCSTIGDPSINLALGNVTNTLCAGELLQLHHRNQCGIDEATYFEIVTRKTASLIGEACALGARLAGAYDETCAAMRSFGVQLGTAFQIQDDLLDLMGEERVVGKSLGKDLDKGKLTLPLILHLKRASQDDRSEFLEAIERRDLASIRRNLKESHSLETCREIAVKRVNDAKAHLERLPAGPARELLDALAEAVIERRF